MVTPIVREIVPPWMQRPPAEHPVLELSTSASAAPVEAPAERS